MGFLVAVRAREVAENVLDQHVPYELHDHFSHNQPNDDPFQLGAVLVRDLLIQHIEPITSHSQRQIKSI